VLDSDDEENALVLPARDKVTSQGEEEESSNKSVHKSSTLDSSIIKREEGDIEQAVLMSNNTGVKADVPSQQQNGSIQEAQPKKENGEEETKQPVESISVVANPHTNEHGSRFYIKKRVIVGNVSKFIPIG